MIRGKVVGQVWCSKKNPKIEGYKLLLVVPYKYDSTLKLDDKVIVAIDTLDTKISQDVLVSFGSGARNVLLPGKENYTFLVDAAISTIIDSSTEG